MSTIMNHPWDETINDYAVVSSSGLSVSRFASEVEARQWCVANTHGYIHVVYGPGFQNRVCVYMSGCWFTPGEFDAVRGV